MQHDNLIWTWPPRPKATGKSAPNAPTSAQYSQLTRGVELVVIFWENCDPAETSVSSPQRFNKLSTAPVEAPP